MNIRATLIVTLLAGGILSSFVIVRHQIREKVRKNLLWERLLSTDLHRQDMAITEWARSYRLKDGAPIDTAAAGRYLKSGWVSRDTLGNDFIIGTVHSNQIMVSPKTKAALAGAGIDWGPY